MNRRDSGYRSMRQHGGVCRTLLVIGLVALAGCSTSVVRTDTGGTGSTVPVAPPASATPEPVPVCRECGIIQRIDTIPAGRTVSSAKGPVLGGIVGGVASRDTTGETSGTTPARDTYNIHVRLQDGRNIMVNQAELAGLRTQMKVRVIAGRVVPQ